MSCRLKFKNDSVNPSAMSAQIMFAITSALAAYDEAGASEMIVTSLNDSRHGKESRHYRGDAVDLSVRSLSHLSVYKAVYKDIKSNLNYHYDVLLEMHMYGKTPVYHIHIEYNQRRPK